MPAPRMCLILSENWTMTSGRDLPSLVRWAREAEDAGFDSVMISEHIVLGPAAAANGIMANPREYALPGNQDPVAQLRGPAVGHRGGHPADQAGRQRDPAALELVGGARAVFPDGGGVADLGQALSAIPPQAAAGFTTFCIKPSQFTDDPAGVGALCRDIVRRTQDLLP
jgi:hypothetical protein